MATYYFDSALGSDTTGNGSQALPWATYNGKYASLANGDVCFFKRGTNQVISTLYRQFRSGTSAAAPFTFGAYGTGANPIFTYPASPWGYILNGGNLKWVTVEDIDFDCGGLSQSGIYIAGQGTGEASGWRVTRCRFYNSSDKPGIVVTKEATATTAIITDIIFRDCDFFDNGGHGFYNCHTTNVSLYGCRAWNNGATNVDGGHGFSHRWNRTDVTSGWTLVSGTVYKRTLSAAEAAGSVDYMQATPYPRMTKNAGTPTTPAAGEFGVSAGELYININTNPSGVAIRFAWGRCGEVRMYGCESWSNVANVDAPYLEGHGIAFDDFTEDSLIERCHSHDNDGAGISLNRGDSNTLRSCLLVDNGSFGVACNTSASAVVDSCTIANNGGGSAYDTDGADSELSFSAGSMDGTIRNCCIKAITGGNTYGINVDPSATGWVVSGCNVTGFTTAVRTVTATGAVSGDPLLTDYKPTASSPLLGAGTHLGYTRDIERKQRPNPPSIGAYDAATLRAV